MAITININTPDTTININSSEDSGVTSPKQKPSTEKKSKDMSPHSLVTEATIKNIKCDHRGEDGHFDVTDIGSPKSYGIFRCNICNELIDLEKPDDPHLIKVTCDHLWSVFQAMKANNSEEDLKGMLDILGMSLYIIKEHMPKILSVINRNVSTSLMQAQHPKTPPFTPNMNHPFFNSLEFSQLFDSKTKAPFSDLDKNAPPKRDEKPPAKPKQQTSSSSK